MSTLARSRGDWITPGSGRPAREQLADVVADLARASWRQHCADCACTALFVWLVCATVAMLAIRVGLVAAEPALVLPGLLVVCLAAAAAAALARRPDSLKVAIAADLALNLKQRLSTAWEFSAAGSDAALAERLAAQAVRARLPARSRSLLVFPLRVNAFGMLAPVAAIALLLASVLDFERVTAPAPVVIDESVVSEGVRLREYGQRMEGRARREALPRSTEAAQQLQRLGNRMESAGLSRGEALSRLRDLDQELDAARRAALGEGESTPIGPLQIDTVDGAPTPAGPDPRAMLRRLLDGQLGAGEAGALGSDPGALARSGVSREALEDALRSFSQGEQSKLRDILEQMAQSEQAREDARELGDAREQVTRARQSLGGAPGAGPRADEPAAQAGARVAGEDASDGLDGPDGDSDGAASGSGGATGARGESFRAQAVRRAPREVDTGAVLQARGQPGEGGVFQSQARVLPRAGQVGIDNVELDARFAPQLEAVLSKEHYPAHHKAFIRRYFLSLSEGQRSQEPAR